MLIRLSTTDENGYYGLMAGDLLFEAGSIEEADIVPYKHSEILWDYVSDNGIVKRCLRTVRRMLQF